MKAMASLFVAGTKSLEGAKAALRLRERARGSASSEDEALAAVKGQLAQLAYMQNIWTSDIERVDEIWNLSGPQGRRLQTRLFGSLLQSFGPFYGTDWGWATVETYFRDWESNEQTRPLLREVEKQRRLRIFLYKDKFEKSARAVDIAVQTNAFVRESAQEWEKYIDSKLVGAHQDVIKAEEEVEVEWSVFAAMSNELPPPTLIEREAGRLASASASSAKTLQKASSQLSYMQLCQLPRPPSQRDQQEAQWAAYIKKSKAFLKTDWAASIEKNDREGQQKKIEALVSLQCTRAGIEGQDVFQAVLVEKEMKLVDARARLAALRLEQEGLETRQMEFYFQKHGLWRDVLSDAVGYCEALLPEDIRLPHPQKGYLAPVWVTDYVPPWGATEAGPANLAFLFDEIFRAWTVASRVTAKLLQVAEENRTKAQKEWDNLKNYQTALEAELATQKMMRAAKAQKGWDKLKNYQAPKAELATQKSRTKQKMMRARTKAQKEWDKLKNYQAPKAELATQKSRTKPKMMRAEELELESVESEIEVFINTKLAVLRSYKPKLKRAAAELKATNASVRLFRRYKTVVDDKCWRAWDNYRIPRKEEEKKLKPASVRGYTYPTSSATALRDLNEGSYSKRRQLELNQVDQADKEDIAAGRLQAGDAAVSLFRAEVADLTLLRVPGNQLTEEQRRLFFEKSYKATKEAAEFMRVARDAIIQKRLEKRLENPKALLVK
jgi:hypothetical protein